MFNALPFPDRHPITHMAQRGFTLIEIMVVVVLGADGRVGGAGNDADIGSWEL